MVQNSANGINCAGMSAILLLEWWCGVQQGHSLKEEAPLVPTGTAAEASVPPARWGVG